ncbi:MAG TPA: hypothetical protein VIH16_05850 [Bellilinea sp.]
MYRWLVFLHVLCAFAFVMAHGVSVSVYFMLRNERNVERVKMLLAISRASLNYAFISLVLILITGIITGIMGQWWGQWWIRVAVLLIFIIWGAMAGIGTRVMNELRIGLGMVSSYNQPPRAEMLSAEQMDALLKKINPALLTLVGFGAIAIWVYLMYFKPF